MTEEEFAAEYITVRNMLPRTSRLHRHGRMGWRFNDSTVWVRLDGALVEDRFATEGGRYVFDEAGQRVVNRNVPVTSGDVRYNVLRFLRGELKRTRDAIARGAATRARRRAAQLKKITDNWLAGRGSIYANREQCACCWKVLSDPESRARGIGPECWEHIKRALEEHIKQAEAEAKQPAHWGSGARVNVVSTTVSKGISHE